MTAKAPLPRPPRRDRDLLWLLLAGFLIFSSGLGFKDPWPPDEPRYALIAKEMVESGQWLFPHRAGELYPDKPPIFFWSIAFFYQLTGSLRVSYLLPSLLAALLTLVLVWDLARRLWHRRIAWWAGLVLLLVMQFPLQAKAGQIDALLCFWTTLGFYGLCRHLLRGPDWSWYNIAWLAMGLGIITKGTGFLPLLAFLPYAVARLRGWPGWPVIAGRWYRWALGPGLLLLAIALWLVPMTLTVAASGDADLAAYRDNILWHQTADRYASSWGHLQPFWFYFLNRIPLLWFPISFFLPWLIPAWIRRLKRHDPRQVLLLGWIFLVVLFFSLSAGKRGVYILPAVPALALAVAPLAPGLWRRPILHKVAFACLVFVTILLLAVALLGPYLVADWQARLAAEGSPALLYVVLALGLWGLVCAIWARRRRGIAGLAGFLAGWWLIFGWGAIPLLNPLRSSAGFMAEIASRIGSDGELAIVDFKEQFMLHGDRPITHFGFNTPLPVQVQRAVTWLDAAPHHWLLLPDEAMSCFAKERAIALGERHRQSWFLLDRTARDGDCPIDAEERVRDGKAEIYLYRPQRTFAGDPVLSAL